MKFLFVTILLLIYTESIAQNEAMNNREEIILKGRKIEYQELDKKKFEIFLKDFFTGQAPSKELEEEGIKIYLLNNDNVIVEEKGNYSLFFDKEDVVYILDNSGDRIKSEFVGLNDDGEKFTSRIPDILANLNSSFAENASLDFSVDSLFELDILVDNLEDTRSFLENNSKLLLVYLGEVIIRENGGNWQLRYNEDFAYHTPYIKTKEGKEIEIEYWLLNSLEEFNFEQSVLDMTYNVLSF